LFLDDFCNLHPRLLPLFSKTNQFRTPYINTCLLRFFFVATKTWKNVVTIREFRESGILPLISELETTGQLEGNVSIALLRENLFQRFLISMISLYFNDVTVFLQSDCSVCCFFGLIFFKLVSTYPTRGLTIQGNFLWQI